MRHLSVLPASILALLIVAPAAFAAPATEQEYTTVIHARTDAARGGMLFATCTRCHGPEGDGATDGSVPAIAGQHFRVIARQLVDYRHDERWDARMEHFADVPYLTFAQDVADVAAYVSTLERGGPRGIGEGEYQQHGGVVYRRQCASCHGAHGEGDNLKAYPRLAGQHYPYLLRQLHDAVEARRPNFPESHVRLLARLDRDDLVGVADYLSRLSP